MTEKSFGVKELSVIGIGTGTPTIKSSENLNLSASTVAVGATLSVDGAVNLAVNNETITGTAGSIGDIKMIGGAPFFYDGTSWREFALTSGTPVTVAEDTEWDNVIFRNSFDSSYTEVSQYAASSNSSSNASLVTSPVKYGTKALRLNSGYLSYPHNNAYSFSGEWTIEGWIYFDTIPNGFASSSNGEALISKFNTSDHVWAIQADVRNSGFIDFSWYNYDFHTNSYGGSGIGSVTYAEAIHNWNHFAVVRENTNGTIHFYFNGVESVFTSSNQVVDNNIVDYSDSDLFFGRTYYQNDWDGCFDDVRISTVARYTSVGISTTATFTPPTQAYPTSGTLTVATDPPGDKYGEIVLGVSPSWVGTSGVTVSQQSAGNYRLTFTTPYSNANDYFVLSQGIDQGYASYVGVARSTTHVDFTINRQSNDAAVDTGSLTVQITNH
jgi:hypothetical protein